ncbi:hypothetical protein ACVWZD_001101 [Streptomyces sp. TE3672]
MDARVASPSLLMLPRQAGIMVDHHGNRRFTKKSALPIAKRAESQASTLWLIQLFPQSGMPVCQPVYPLGYMQALISVHLRGRKLDEMCARTFACKLAIVHVSTPAQEHGSRTVALDVFRPACPAAQLPARRPASLGRRTFASGGVSPRVGNQGRRRLSKLASSRVCRGVDELARQRAHLTAPTSAGTLTRPRVEEREVTPASVLACPRVHRGADKRARRPPYTRAHLTAPTNAGTLTRPRVEEREVTPASVLACPRVHRGADKRARRPPYTRAHLTAPTNAGTLART